MTDLEQFIKDGCPLDFRDIQTDEICMAAVKHSGSNLYYVQKQTLEIIIEALEDYSNWANDTYKFISSKFIPDL